MTSTNLLPSIVIATAILGGSALAHTVYAQGPADQTRERVANDNCRDRAQASRADRADDARCERSARRDERRQRKHEGRVDGADPLWLPVANTSAPEQEAYGWQYFSDPRVARAVVISPAGEYYLSLGKGPRQITGPAGQLLTLRPAGN